MVDNHRSGNGNFQAQFFSNSTITRGKFEFTFLHFCDSVGVQMSHLTSQKQENVRQWEFDLQ